VLRPDLSRACLAKAVTFVTRVALGCVFLTSSLPKLRQPYDFLSNVYEYELVGPTVGVFVAMVFPWLELILGIFLLGGVFIGGAFLCSALLGGVFVFAQVYALIRGLNIACGCFGSGHMTPVTWGSVLRTSLLLLTAAIGYTLVLMHAPESTDVHSVETGSAVAST